MTCVPFTVYDVQFVYGTYLHKSRLQHILSSFEYVLFLVHILTEDGVLYKNPKEYS